MDNIAVMTARKIPARMILISDTPADFILASSYFSAILPKTITEEMSIVSGIESGIIVIAKYESKVITSKKEIPFPNISSTNFHSSCMSNTNSATKKEAKYGPQKLLSTNLSMVLNKVSYCLFCFTQIYMQI